MVNNDCINFKYVSELPFAKAHENDSCYDIRSSQDYIIKPFKSERVKTGLYLELPIGTEGVVRPRSGFSTKNQTIILNSPGTIDSNYRGEIEVSLMNLSNVDLYISRGDRIAQMKFEYVTPTKAEKVDSIDSNTDRGIGGFGSTGMK